MADGLESVTLSSGGKTVVLDREFGRQAREHLAALKAEKKTSKKRTFKDEVRETLQDIGVPFTEGGVVDLNRDNAPTDTSADKELKSIIERIERLEEEKSQTACDIKDVYLEAKDRGYDPKAIKKVVSRRRMNPDKRRELDDTVDLYEARLGMDRQRSIF